MTKIKISVNAAGLEQLRVHAESAGTLANWAPVAMEWIRAADAELARRAEEIEVLRAYGNKDCTAMADTELARRRGTQS